MPTTVGRSWESGRRAPWWGGKFCIPAKEFVGGSPREKQDHARHAKRGRAAAGVGTIPFLIYLAQQTQSEKNGAPRPARAKVAICFVERLGMASIDSSNVVRLNILPYERRNQRKLPFIVDAPAPMLKRNDQLSKNARNLYMTMGALADGRNGELKINGRWIPAKAIDSAAEMCRDVRMRCMRELRDAGLVTFDRERVPRIIGGRKRVVAGRSRYVVHKTLVKAKPTDSFNENTRVSGYMLQKSSVKPRILLKSISSTVQKIDPQGFSNPPYEPVPSNSVRNFASEKAPSPHTPSSSSKHPPTGPIDENERDCFQSFQPATQQQRSTAKALLKKDPVLRAWMLHQIFSRVGDQEIRNRNAYLFKAEQKFIDDFDIEVEAYLTKKAEEYLRDRFAESGDPVTRKDIMAVLQLEVRKHNLPVGDDEIFDRSFRHAVETLRMWGLAAEKPQPAEPTENLTPSGVEVGNKCPSSDRMSSRSENDFNAKEIRLYLRRSARKLYRALNTAVEEDSPGANKLEVLEAFHRAAEEIYDMADQLPTPDKIETRLKSLNQYLETTFERNLPEDVRVAMRSKVATKLRPFRERVNSEELARMDGELTKQLIIKHFRAERLSLFGIGGRTARLAERTRGNHDVAQEAAEVSVTRAEIPPEIIAVEDFIMKFYAAYPAHRRGTLEEVRAVVWDYAMKGGFAEEGRGKATSGITMPPTPTPQSRDEQIVEASDKTTQHVASGCTQGASDHAESRASEKILHWGDRGHCGDWHSGAARGYEYHSKSPAGEETVHVPCQGQRFHIGEHVKNPDGRTGVVRAIANGEAQIVISMADA